jgi:hypothetical protein
MSDSDSDDDNKSDPTAFFLYELRNVEPWDATETREHAKITRQKQINQS